MISDKIVCIILARGGSKAIPNKNITRFCGAPLIAHSIKQASESKYITDVYVSSDSDTILETSEHYGAKLLKRPDWLSTDSSTSESALRHFLLNVDCDVVVFAQATSPLRHSSDFDNAIIKYCEGNYDSMFSACEAQDFFVWQEREEKLSSITYDHHSRSLRQHIRGLLLENGSFYIFKKKGFLTNNNRLFGNIGYYLMDSWKRYEIDEPDDLEICAALYNKRMKKWKD